MQKRHMSTRTLSQSVRILASKWNRNSSKSFAEIREHAPTLKTPLTCAIIGNFCSKYLLRFLHCFALHVGNSYEAILKTFIRNKYSCSSFKTLVSHVQCMQSKGVAFTNVIKNTNTIARGEHTGPCIASLNLQMHHKLSDKYSMVLTMAP